MNRCFSTSGVNLMQELRTNWSAKEPRRRAIGIRFAPDHADHRAYSNGFKPRKSAYEETLAFPYCQNDGTRNTHDHEVSDWRPVSQPSKNHVASRPIDSTFQASAGETKADCPCSKLLRRLGRKERDTRTRLTSLQLPVPQSVNGFLDGRAVSSNARLSSSSAIDDVDVLFVGMCPGMQTGLSPRDV